MKILLIYLHYILFIKKVIILIRLKLKNLTTPRYATFSGRNQGIFKEAMFLKVRSSPIPADH